MSLYTEIANKIGLEESEISHDLTIFYDRVKKHKMASETICVEWGSVENYVNILYWMKFVKKYNPTQMKNIVKKSSLPRSYRDIGWGYNSFDFDECNNLYNEYLVKLGKIEDEFNYDDIAYESEDFKDKSKNARGVVSRKLLPYYKSKTEEELIRKIYFYYYIHELSAYDISRIFGFSSRAIEQLLTQLDMKLTPSESQKRAAKKRDYTQMEITRRHTMVNNLAYDGLFGSHVENIVRTLLSTKIEGLLANEFEIIIGLNTRTIIPPREIDIPIIMIRKSDNVIFKIAVEVDGENYHTSEQVLLRDQEKNSIVQEHGWKIVRVFIPKSKNTDSESSKDLNIILDDTVKSIYEYVIDKNDKPVDKENLCPQCSGVLIKRTATRGKFAGNTFWGCSNYPNCKYIKNE